MSWSKPLPIKAIRGAVCLLLCAAILAAVCLPVLRRGTQTPANPIPAQPIREITVFEGGEGDGAEGGLPLDGTDAASSGSASSDAEPPEQSDSQPEQSGQEPTRPEGSDASEPVSDNAAAPQPETVPAPDGAQSDGQTDGDDAPLELSLVMTWYKYGTLAKTLVCAPGETVGRRILRTQLAGSELEYDLSLYGEDAENAEITGVLCAQGDGRAREAARSGSLSLSSDEEQRFTFTVTARAERIDPDGTRTWEDLSFTVVLTIRSGLDLDLELAWTQADGTSAALVCGADASASRTLKAAELPDGQLAYSLRLLGEAAEDAELLSASYTTASGEASGPLTTPDGLLSLLPPEGTGEETFYLTVTALVGQGAEQQRLYYTFALTCVRAADVRLCFHYYTGGTERHELLCDPGESVSASVKSGQLVAGGLLYDMALDGDDAKDARITAVRYTSEGGGEGALSASGSLAMSLPDDRTSASYTITVTAALWQGAEQTELSFTVRLRLSGDVRLELRYTVYPDGAAEERLVACEAGKTQTAEAIFDDQLPEGLLSYRMSLAGEDAQSLRITSVQCYQSGSGASVSLSAEGSVTLLPNGAKVGENTFTVTAQDDSGQSFRFTVSIPYRPRGKNLVKIETNLTDGMTVTNDTPVNLSVRAWSEDENGTLISHILSSGTDTELRVTLDGVEVRCDSTSGTLQQYVLLPENPEKGDHNEHTLTIYASDAYGNSGELTLTLLGQRTQAGQQIGTAQIYIDLSALGLGIRGPIRYSVLSEEPISYSVAKAVWGYDAGEVFGTADESFGWPSSSCSYSGTLDKGFYLTALGDGSGLGAQASALGGRSWNALGTNEAEILAAIDAHFGQGSALAALWRCIYRNGIALGAAASGDSVGEFDFTTGSGWMYTLSGTFFPGSSMSEYYLKDGDTLTLRYTLAYGWDIGGGSGSYGNSVGYCVTASGGSISVSHQYELVEQDGTRRYVCRCCGTEEQCPHERTEWFDLEDGTCEQRCLDCGDPIAAPQAHDWTYAHTDDADTHTATCQNCGASEPQAHEWDPGEDSATCTEPGSMLSVCTLCGAEREEPTPAKGHNPENVWYHDGAAHWQLCQRCGEEVETSRGEHTYVYSEAESDWLCTGCGALHGWDGCGSNDALRLVSSSCEELVWQCPSCGLTLRRSGSFEEYHSYENGVCTVCGAPDPAWKPPEPEQPSEPGPDDPESPEE